MKRYIFIICCFSLLFSVGCISTQSIKGNGELVSEKLDISTYNRIVVSGNDLVLNYTQNDETPSLLVHTDQNIFEMFSFRTKGNTLEITPKEKYRNEQFRPTKFIITTNSPSLVSVSASRGATINLTNILKGDRMEVNISGGCKLYFKEGARLANLKLQVSGGGQTHGEKLSLERLDAHVSGGGRVVLDGEMERGEFHVSGGGRVIAGDLKGKEADAHVSGGGRLEVYASEKLSAQASGGGSISYKGSPRVDQKTSGGGSVRQIN